LLTSLAHSPLSSLHLSTFRLPTHPSPLFFYCSLPHRALHSFPTRRSSDLRRRRRLWPTRARAHKSAHRRRRHRRAPLGRVADKADRKSTRLNSSHVKISYAVFCLKKKK